MKKFLLVILLVMLSSFMFLGISQAGECIYIMNIIDNEKGTSTSEYLDSSSVKYSGDIVDFMIYEDDDACEYFEVAWFMEIDCARKMYRVDEGGFGSTKWSSWKSIYPGSFHDTMRMRLCR